MNDRTYYFNRWLMTYGTPDGFADWWSLQIKLHGGRDDNLSSVVVFRES